MALSLSIFMKPLFTMASITRQFVSFWGFTVGNLMAPSLSGNTMGPVRFPPLLSPKAVVECSILWLNFVFTMILR